MAEAKLSDRAREQVWRTTVQRRRRDEQRQRAETMRLQKLRHDLKPEDPRRPSQDQVDDAKRKLREVRTALGRAEDALAKVRQDIAGKSAPPIATAEQVGLRFGYPFGLKGAVTRGAGHYTAGRRCRNMAELKAEAISDHHFHASKGWGGLSYEAMIADDGSIFLGSPTNRKSAAVAMQNTGMVNICCPGTTGHRMTEAQKNSVRWLLANWHTSKVPSAHRLPRPARSVGWKGHKQYPGQSTACPGAMLSDYEVVFHA